MFLKTKEPYQLFFPLGFLWGFMGIGLWILFFFKFLSFYPRTFHAEIMMGGFYLTFATGFLMTAIPRMTGTNLASSTEKITAFIIVVAAFLVSLREPRLYFYAALLLQALFLVFFGGRRFLKRTNSPPPAFVFVGAGFLGLIIGLILMMWGESRLGALLFLYGGFLGPVLGIGSFLIPMILGNPVPANTCSSNGQAAGKNCPKRKLILSLGLILFLFVSFYLEAKGIIRSAYLLRASVVSFVLLKNFRILKKPTNSGMLAWILQISCWALLVGFWPSVLWPSLALHFNHIIFIGTVSLMIFGVITRVSLAHGGFGFEPEKKSRALMMVLIFLLAALLMRVMAPFFPQVYFSHLAYASIFWILAAFIWLARFIRCLLKNH